VPGGALILTVNQHIHRAFGPRGTDAVGVDAKPGAGKIVYAGELRMGGQHDGVELRHQLFPPSVKVRRRIILEVESMRSSVTRRMRSYMLTSTTPNNFVCPPGMATAPTWVGNANTFSTLGV
jgi:hypothetical protein